MRKVIIPLSILLVALVSPSYGADGAARTGDAPPAAKAATAQPGVDYVREIKSLFKERCFACHGALKQESGLRLDTAASMVKGGDGGPVIVPGKPGESRLVERIAAEDEALRMPPEGAPLKPEEIARIKAWIEQGARAPENEQPELDPREHWAFQKPARPELPVVPAAPGSSPASAGRHAIDAFIDAKLAAEGLTPRPPAEKHVLLRRVYLDLIGLPPSREELSAFLADESPTAYEKVVDRLLNDPRHGERWARHWMDIWRYSDWYGRRHVPDVWNSAPQIWRWRDWIVRSLNEDHGYDRMVREMLAADEVCPEDAEAGVATGYLIRNWYALNPNDWMRNTVEHTGKAFLGLTFNCAHCHDHKYDPITHEEYFRMRAFFEPMGIRQDRVAGEANPGPFQEYDYSVLRKIQRLGAVRIFDKTPEAPTWFYTGGDERNRVKDRGSISPGAPAFLAEAGLKIEPVDLPPRAWYPGLQPAMQETVLAEARAAVGAAEAAVSAAKQGAPEVPAPAREQLAQAQAAFEKARTEATATHGALSGKQSLLLDASAGRRIVQNKLEQLKSLEDGAALEFQLLILDDAHINFQLAKDIVKGLTAGYVAFEKGRIVSYQPGGFSEFETGRYDFAAGERHFHVRLVIQTQTDRCLLSIRLLKRDAGGVPQKDKLLVDAVPVALNGWNPVGDPVKAITFDARPGSVAAIDDVLLTAPAAAGDDAQAPVRRLAFDFEAPGYAEGRDAVGLEGWFVSHATVAPATSTVVTTLGTDALREAQKALQAAQRAARLPQLAVLAAEARLAAARAEQASVEARIAADRAKFGETAGADVSALSRAASRLEREAARLKAEADALAAEKAVADAEAKPASDAGRAKAVEAANASLTAAQAAGAKAQAALSDEKLAETYTALSPVYPKTSTGRRQALAEWITSRDNPLAARVAVNHIWARHFHAPLVASVYDFGRNGVRPTHPQLLDWLAVELMDGPRSGDEKPETDGGGAGSAGPWRMKHIHRLIVTSAAYRRASSSGDGMANIAADPENKLLWRMNAGRMEAEVVRDSLLYCGGKLDLKMGGQELENADSLKSFRRSLYYSVYPEEGGKSQLGELFDAPDALECYRRTRTIVPQQALALTNADFVHETAANIARWAESRMGAEGEEAADRFVTAVFERVLSRTPTPAELKVCREALQTQHELLAKTNAADALPRARESLVRAVLNHNDFVTIR